MQHFDKYNATFSNGYFFDLIVQLYSYAKNGGGICTDADGTSFSHANAKPIVNCSPVRCMAPQMYNYSKDQDLLYRHTYIPKPWINV